MSYDFTALHAIRANTTVMPKTMKELSAISLVLALTLLLEGQARSSPVTVYRCGGPEDIEYADTPCGSNAQTQEIINRRLGGTLNEGLSPAVPFAKGQADPSARSGTPDKASDCRDFQSTNLRSYLIREQIVHGMTRAQVRRAWGTPVEAYTEPVEMWIYDTTYYGRLLSVTRVYFRQGCVTIVETTSP